VKKLLEQYDPELPYAITDNLWYGDGHPSRVYPRCLPCHYQHTPQVTTYAMLPASLDT
jgi:hypothetical protein